MKGKLSKARLVKAHLVKPTDGADYHSATPLLTTPGETLGKSVNLIVVATGKGDQLGDEFFQPSGALGKSDGSSGEQVGLGNQARASLAESKLEASIFSYDGKAFVRTETTLMQAGQSAVGTKNST